MPRPATGWLRIALVGVICLFVAWQVVQTSAADALIRQRPGAAAAMAPQDPRVAIGRAMREFEATGRLPLTQVRRATRALARAGIVNATQKQKLDLAAIIHLCGAGAGERHGQGRWL